MNWKSGLCNKSVEISEKKTIQREDRLEDGLHRMIEGATQTNPEIA